MPRIPIDITGQRFGFWTVISCAGRPSATNRNTLWNVRCDCGAESAVAGAHLKRGASTSCGCFRRVATSQRARVKFGDPLALKSQYPAEAAAWRGAIARCEDPSLPNFVDYGGRGIRVCVEWRHDFAKFLADMGPRPSAKHSIDRIDNNGNYTHLNCRWATPAEQARNRRCTAFEKHEPAQIRWLCSLGYKQREVASFYGVFNQMVQSIVAGKTWVEAA